MATTSDIRNGLCIEFKHSLWTVVEFQHVKPGKGPAFVRTKLKNLSTGKVLDHTIPAGHKIETARVERRKYQFLYKEGDMFVFMNNETYDQVSLEEKIINNSKLLRDGDQVEIVYHAEKELALTCELPQFVSLEVTHTEPGLKGDTATNALKPATVSTGAQIMVPLFVNEGDTIKIDSGKNSYVERVKK